MVAIAPGTENTAGSSVTGSSKGSELALSFARCSGGLDCASPPPRLKPTDREVERVLRLIRDAEA